MIATVKSSRDFCTHVRAEQHPAQIARLRAATPEERLREAADLRRISLEVLRAGVEATFPALTADEVEVKVGEIIFGREFWQKVCELRRRRKLDRTAP